MLPWQLMLFSAHSVEMTQEDLCCGPDSEMQPVGTNTYSQLFIYCYVF